MKDHCSRHLIVTAQQQPQHQHQATKTVVELRLSLTVGDHPPNTHPGTQNYIIESELSHNQKKSY